jgi:autotransporter passenger strand-loop-strand repeat protein
LQGGTEIVLSGGSEASNYTGYGGTVYGSEVVSAGGAADGGLVLLGGSQTVLGSAESMGIGLGGSETISAGGSAYGDAVSGGSQSILSGGVDSASTILSGGQQTVFVGGAAYCDAVLGGAQSDYGLTSGTTIASGGAETVFSGAVDSSSIISGGGTEYVGGRLVLLRHRGVRRNAICLWRRLRRDNLERRHGARLLRRRF